VTRIVLLAILLLAVGWAFWRIMDGVIEAFGGRPGRTVRGKAAVKLVRDPVCGTWVSPGNARSLQRGSAMHYFCSDECRLKFEKRS
jgi:YHS domain-containing protein